MAKEHKYTFAQKVHSKSGRDSSIFAGISLLLFVAAAIISFAYKGKAGVYIGGIALMAMLFSVYGFIIGLRGFSEKNCAHTLCITGAISNGIIMVGWLALALIGI
ncbi:MAG: hypothetical protein PHS82_11865 [Lachnospiraceae bacterium]|nr:hypothetical protein [Lachnospiraceae bacterium]